MEKHVLMSVNFKKLKGLTNANIVFSNTLTAIMGVNGSGKTTVIHALACLYQPDGKGENHKFPEFFVPNTDSLWTGSEFYVVNESENAEGKRIVLSSKRYSKDFDRWCPRYDNRPKRNVYYIGIDTCLPDIEKKTTTSRIIYKSEYLTDKLSSKSVELSAYILNKDYNQLIDNTYNKKHFTGVELKNGLKYSSLSMGSGEQRVIKIINSVLAAEPYSLILIDEIDLLLHVSALRRLIEKIYELAIHKHIQIVFTTHSLEMTTLSRYVKIQYLSNCGDNKPTVVFDTITNDLIYSMTGDSHKSHQIYVEDMLAKHIINEIVRNQRKGSMVEVIKYGSASNAFTIAASIILQNEATQNKLIVLDGDKYTSTDDKEKQIKSKLSGTEDDADEKRMAALGMITEFALPDSTSPEEFLHHIILKCFSQESDIYQAADEIKAVSDSHEWIFRIREKLGLSESQIIHEIFENASEDEEFQIYIYPICEWLSDQE